MKSNEQSIRASSHQGHVWMYLARNYNTIPAVILEAVQNAIDVGAAKINVFIDKTKGTMLISDNGSGASRERVRSALKSVAATMKEKSKFGQFGIGLISPLSIAKRFNFTTCARPLTNDYVSYKFVTKDIEQSHEIDIPFAPAPHLHHDPEGPIWWRSQVEIFGLTKERRPSTVVLKDLAISIALKFGEAIRERQIDIHVEMVDDKGVRETIQVEAPRFKGIKLDIFETNYPESGPIKMELFIAQRQKSVRKGAILFGSFDNPSRITHEQFVRCAREMLDSQVVKVLSSGVFEGVILCKNISLHPDRTRFVDNDALLALCLAMETWYKQVGAETFKNINEESQNDYLRDISIAVMPLIEAMIELPQFAGVLEGIKIGSIGDGHARVPKNHIIGPDDGTSFSTDGAPGKERGNHSGRDGGERDTGGKVTERKNHRPAIVYGPGGKTRTEVSSNSTGLRLKHTEFDDFRIPFEFDPETGTLAINTRHSYFGQCQREKNHLQQYHGVVATIALSLELHRDKHGHINHELIEFAHASLETHVFTILHSQALVG